MRSIHVQNNVSVVVRIAKSSSNIFIYFSSRDCIYYTVESRLSSCQITRHWISQKKNGVKYQSLSRNGKQVCGISKLAVE